MGVFHACLSIQRCDKQWNCVNEQKLSDMYEKVVKIGFILLLVSWSRYYLQIRLYSECIDNHGSGYLGMARAFSVQGK